MVLKGRVIYSSGGNYKVLVNDKAYFSKPLGIFRKKNIKILVGDFVDVQINENKNGLQEINVINKLYKRKNEFIRPNISNIDEVILVTSVIEPKLNHYYLDKLIMIFQNKNIIPIIIFTKIDIEYNKKNKDIVCEYRNAGFNVIETGNFISDENKKIIHNWTKEKLTVITGQTGVGKSTLLNNMNNKFKLKTNEISKALGRGKHTTRHSEAFEIFKSSYIIDTPGFSSLEIHKISKNEISWNFFDFGKYAGKCKFNDCLHLTEKGCYIKKRNYSKRTMDNYKKLLNEVEKSKSNY